MNVVERSVSAGNRAVFDLEEFLTRPLYAYLAHNSEQGRSNRRSGSTGTARRSGSSVAHRSRQI